MQLKQVILDTEPLISRAVGAEQIYFTHCPAHSWGPPAAQGVKPFSAAGKHWPRCHPALGRVHHTVQTVQGSAFRTARQLLCRLLKISSEKQTGFVPFHPVEAHKKISTLYKEQQWYNLNMHPATNHIYRENRPIQTEQDHFITLEFRWSFWRMADKENQTEGGGCCFWK